MDDFYDRAGTSSYWKLNDGEHLGKETLHQELYNNNFHVLKSTKLARLRELYVRSQRGMRSYEGTSRKELEHCVAQRRLLPSNPSLHAAPTYADIKTQLEQDDDENNTSHRFLYLPPELRERIYTQYLNTYDDDNPKCQPPISYASRIVRREVLPLFYECCHFALRTDHIHLPFDKPITDEQRIGGVLSPRSGAFIKDLSATNLGFIRSLRLDFFDCKIQLKLDARDHNDAISIETPSIVDLGCRRDTGLRERKERMLSDLCAIAKGVVAREGPLKLRVEDLERVYETVRIAFAPFYKEW